MDRWKAEIERVREKRRVEERRAEERRSEKRKSQKKEDAGARKSRLAKAAGAEPSGQMRDEKLHAVVARSTFPSQNVQSTTCSDHLWKLRCRKSARRCGAKHISKSKCTKHTSSGPLLEVEMSKKCAPRRVARSTFRSQNAQNTPGSDHIWRLRFRKSALHCGAKHMSKSKCTKHHMLGPLLEIEMSKKCTPLWRQAHVEVKLLKAPHVRATFGRSGVVLLGRHKGLCTLSKVSKMWGICSISNNGGRRGTFEDLPRWIFRRHVYQRC